MYNLRNLISIPPITCPFIPRFELLDIYKLKFILEFGADRDQISIWDVITSTNSKLGKKI